MKPRGQNNDFPTVWSRSHCNLQMSDVNFILTSILIMFYWNKTQTHDLMCYITFNILEISNEGSCAVGITHFCTELRIKTLQPSLCGKHPRITKLAVFLKVWYLYHLTGEWGVFLSYVAKTKSNLPSISKLCSSKQPHWHHWLGLYHFGFN